MKIAVELTKEELELLCTLFEGQYGLTTSLPEDVDALWSKLYDHKHDLERLSR